MNIIKRIFGKKIHIKDVERLGYKSFSSFGKGYVYTKEFEIGDIVYFFGHDGVGGFWVGDKVIVDEELHRKKDNLHFWKRVCKIKY